MRQVVSKMARKTQQQSQQPLGGGKENSTIFDAPSAPTHRINANASAAPASRCVTLPTCDCCQPGPCSGWGEYPVTPAYQVQ